MTHALTAPVLSAESSRSSHSDRSPSSDGRFVDAEPAVSDVLDSHLPLRSAAALDVRVRQLIPCAVQTQVWLVLLDGDDVQMPVMIPVGEFAQRLADDAPAAAASEQSLGDLLESLVAEFEAVSFVFVVERPGDASAQQGDRRLIERLFGLERDRRARPRPFRVRAVYLAHDDGVAGYEPGEIVDAEVIDADAGVSDADACADADDIAAADAAA